MEYLLKKMTITYKEIDSVIRSKSFSLRIQKRTTYNILTVIEMLERKNLDKIDYRVTIFLDF